MKEQLLCLVTPQARTYYKAQCVAKEFLDKDHNIINTTGVLPDGEILEVTTGTATRKHLEEGKLHGTLEVLDLTDNSITFSEEYDHGQLVHVTEHTLPPTAIAAATEKTTPLYPGTVLKTSKDVRAFYVNGKQIAEETIAPNGATVELLGNIPDGEVKEFTENGKLKIEANYLGNKLHGNFIRYDEQGRVLSKETYDQGILKGPAEYYSYTNQHILKTTCSYKNALLDGEWTLTQQDGTVRERTTYTRGRQNGEHHTFYANGSPEIQETFTEGKLTGERKLFFPSSQLWYTETYVNGRLDGDRTEFFPNGKTRLTEFYCDGMLNGQRNIYSENGELIVCEEYHWGNIIHNTEYRPL